MTKLTFKYATKLFATPERKKVLVTIPADTVVDCEDTATVILQRMGNRGAMLKVIAMGAITGYASAKYARFAERDSGEAESE